MRVLTVLLGLFWAATPLQGQLPRLSTDLDTTFVTVGDRITLQISVDHHPTSRIVWPDSLDLRPFEILDARLNPPAPSGEIVRSSLTLILTAFELGDLEIPGFSVEVVNPEGETTDLVTNPYGIRVSSVGLDEGGDIRGLKDPLWIPMGPGRVALLLLAVLLVSGLFYILYRWVRRDRTEERMGTPAPPSRPPHEIALEALAILEASPLLERGEVKEFHIRLSDILRTYAEGRFNLPALEMTTGDLMAGMERAGNEPWVSEAFEKFLVPCDMVKFAKYRPGAEDARLLLRQGRQLVEDTHQVAAPVGASPEETHEESSDDPHEDPPGDPPEDASENAPKVRAV